MSTDPNNPEILTSVATEIEAAAIKTALAERGVEASTTGGYTAGFRAEAPGVVNVIVRQEDLPRAQQILSELRQNPTNVDWSQVDVGHEESDENSK